MALTRHNIPDDPSHEGAWEQNNEESAWVRERKRRQSRNYGLRNSYVHHILLNWYDWEGDGAEVYGWYEKYTQNFNKHKILDNFPLPSLLKLNFFWKLNPFPSKVQYKGTIQRYNTKDPTPLVALGRTVLKFRPSSFHVAQILCLMTETSINPPPQNKTNNIGNVQTKSCLW